MVNAELWRIAAAAVLALEIVAREDVSATDADASAARAVATIVVDLQDRRERKDIARRSNKVIVVLLHQCGV